MQRSGQRIFVKVTRETLPQAKDRYPFLYLEHGRLAIDDSSVKWIDKTGSVIRLPIATISALFLGPGTSVTHEAIKILAASICSVFWVGEDCLLFYAAGDSPTADTRNFRHQMEMACSPACRLEVARRMFLARFQGVDISEKSLSELMGMEGRRVKELYEQKARTYQVGWTGRSFTPGKFELSSVTNQILTSCNAALYGVVCSVIHAMGYSPHIGFVHTGSPLPFVYDIADLYKEDLSIDLAFSLTKSLAGRYDKYVVADQFRDRVIRMDLLHKIAIDIPVLLGEKRGRRCS